MFTEKNVQCRQRGLYKYSIVYKARCTTENWTEPNSAELNCLVKFNSVSRCALNRRRHLRRSGTVRRRNWRSSHVLHNWGILSWIGQSMQRLSLDENRRRSATTGDGRRWLLTIKNLRRPSPVVAGSKHSEKLNWTKLSWTEPPSSVQLSSIQFSFPLYTLGFSRI